MAEADDSFRHNSALLRLVVLQVDADGMQPVDLIGAARSARLLSAIDATLNGPAQRVIQPLNRCLDDLTYHLASRLAYPDREHFIQSHDTRYQVEVRLN